MDDSGRAPGGGDQGRVRRLGRAIRRAAFPLAIAGIALLLVKFVFADRFLVTKFVFYIPSALLAPFAVLCALASRGGQARRFVSGTAALILGGLMFHVEQPILFSPGRVRAGEKTGSIRVMSFNVQAYFWGSGRVARVIQQEKPDVICFIEGTFAQKAPPQMVKALGSEYHWVVGKRLSIASKFPIRDGRQISSTSELYALGALIESPQGDLSVIAIDVKNPISRNDQSAFDQLYAVLQSQPGPFVALGDFNAPNGSWQLSRAVDGLQDDLLTAGEGGYQASWPSPLPLWQIDHAYSRGVTAQNSRTVRAFASDHFPIVVDYSLSR